MIEIFLGFLSGLGKATRDTITFHWGWSIFNRIKNEKIREWFESKYENRPKHPISPLWDGWHFGDFLANAGQFLMMGNIIYKVFNFASCLRIVLFYFIFWIVFEILFHKVFVCKK